MIVTPASGRWVVLTTSAGGILDTQVLRLDGTVKLVQFPVDERHVPSFHLTASSVFDRLLSTVMKPVIVPPVEHFIDVDVTTDREEYEPRSEGTVVITTKDVDGKPVAAEVAIAVSDEAVTAISADPAGDPRQFFFGEQRGYAMHVAASVQTQRYLLLIEKDGELYDDRVLDNLRRRKERDGSVAGDMRDASAVAPPAPPPPPAAPAALAEAITVTAQAAVGAASKMAANEARQEEPQSAPIDIQVRSDFRSTAFWQPDVRTGPDGTARVTVKFPEALTTWRATARAVTTATRVGMGSVTARTSMPLLVRLQAPRFFVAGDRATVSAVINNNTDEPMDVVPSIVVEGVTLGAGVAATANRVTVPPHGEVRADWLVVAERAGSAKLRVTAEGTARGDAMERTLPVFEHGIDKLVARSGKLRSDDSTIRLELPRERRATDLTIQIQPSLAATMTGALPYLVNFPYGCTEQTMSRFLPAAIVSRTLATLGYTREPIPNLAAVTAASIARLYDFQHPDGGWGWWKEGESDDFMTAYVVWGFAVAKEGGLRVDDNRIAAAVRYLDLRLVEREKDRSMQTWMLHAIAAWRKVSGGGAMSANQRTAFDNVWGERERLNSYSRALLALAAHDFGDSTRAAVLIRNLENGVKIDRAPDRSILVAGSGANAAETMATAHWGETGFWWRWYESPVESTAFALRALVRIDPANKLIEPAMNWLAKNRRGAQWSNTRDTAIAVLALNDYLIASGEMAGELAYEVSVNGRVVETARIEKSEALGAVRRISVDPALVRDSNDIRIRRTGGLGPIYFAVEGRFVSLEEPVTAAGNELFVRREYYRLSPKPTLLKGVVYDRLPLTDHGQVASGERVEVVVTIETKNDYEYLMFEDLKPGGLEAVALQSGDALSATEAKTQRSVRVHQELRDRKVALFIDHLPQGIWEVRYTLRAEVPGSFHALPLLGQAMYVPDIRANGDEVRLTVTE
ncbi:MAG TPA: alpha-2-macroglobulin family protein, partial [Thermoanaerobaculia bacterium]|nr:alpha-2-macroglobulin family protein [Thermoanaerobaculia bacterium]